MIARVLTDDLLVRSAPGTGSASAKLRPLLDTGQQVFVLDGPVSASGYDWYLVQPLGSNAPAGWVAAASRSGEKWLGAASITCPPVPDLAALASMDPHLALACNGHQEITLTARLGVDDGLVCPDSPPLLLWTYEPSWFDPCSMLPSLTPLEGEPDPGFFRVRLDPAIEGETLSVFGGDLENWTTVEVTGQYDHPAARICRVKADADSEQPPRPEVVVLGCRSEFVVTSIHVADQP